MIIIMIIDDDSDDANETPFIGGRRRLLCRSDQTGQAGKICHSP